MVIYGNSCLKIKFYGGKEYEEETFRTLEFRILVYFSNNPKNSAKIAVLSNKICNFVTQ